METFDLIVIGAGPAGIATAIEAISAGVAAEKVLVLEKGPQHSYAIRKFYPDDKRVDALYKGIVPRCEGRLCISDGSKQQTLDYLGQAIAEHRLRVQYEEGVDTLARGEDGVFEVHTPRGAYRARVCVVAIGILGKPNKPDYKIPSPLKKRVHFDVTSEELGAGSGEALVVGGGDSAADYAHYLVGRGFHVDLSYRRAELTRMNHINVADIQGMAAAGRLRLLLPTDVTSLEDDGGRPRVVFAQRASQTYDHVVYALGGSTPAGFLQSTGIELHGGEPELREGGETNVPGLFLAGDLTAGKKGGSIISAFNSGVAAMRVICRDYLECRVPDLPGPVRKAT